MYEVVIIGAGFAGLTAARELRSKQSCHNFVVLEASKRSGGRAQSIDFAGDTLDRGATWIHGGDHKQPVFATRKSPFGMITNPNKAINPIFSITKYKKIPIIPAGNPPQIAISINGQPFNQKVSEVYLQAYFELIQKVAQPLQQSGDSNNNSPAPTTLARATKNILATMTLDDRIDRQQFSLYTQHRLMATYGASPDDIDCSALQQYQSYFGPQWAIPSSYQSILNAEYRYILDKIKFSRRVISIVKDPSQNLIRVGTEHGEFLTRKVIVTVPLGVLKKEIIKFMPSLPQNKQNAIKQLGFSAVNKVFLEFDEVFWPDDPLIFTISLDGEIISFTNMWPIKNKPILVALLQGNLAKEAETHFNELQQKLLKFLQSGFGEKIPSPKTVACSNWLDDPNTYGAYTFIPPHQSQTLCDDLAAYEDLGNGTGISFAGEHTDPSMYATTHGALNSGIRAAEHVEQLLTDELTQHFLRLGFNAPSKASRLAKNSTYRQLTLQAPKDCVLDNIKLETSIHTTYFTFTLHSDHMTLLALQELLLPPDKLLGGDQPSFHDGTRTKNGKLLYAINILFALYNSIENDAYHTDTPDSIRWMLHSIFDKLELIPSKEGSRISLQVMRQQTLQFAEQYFIDFANDFAGPKEVVRNPPPLLRTSTSKDERPSEATDALYHAVDEGDVGYVREYLRHNGNPDVRWWKVPILSNALISNDNDPRRDEDLLAILELLLEYGVDTRVSIFYGNALATQVFRTAIAKPGSRERLLGMEMIRRLQAYDNRNTSILIPPSHMDDPNSVGYLVYQGQRFLAQRRSMPTIIKYSETTLAAPFKRQSFTMHDKVVLTVESRPWNDVKHNTSIVSQMFTIFQSRFLDRMANMSEEQQRIYFHEAITCCSGTSFIDLVWRNNQVRGFSMSQMVPVNKNNKPAQLHRIQLTIAGPDIEAYHRFMNLLAYYRGFCTPNEETLTVYESVSIPSYLLAIGFQFFPNSLIEPEWISLILQHFYSVEESHWHDKYLYVKDELACFDDVKQQPFHTRTSIAAKRLKTEISKNGYALVVAFANTPRNTAQYQTLLSKATEQKNEVWPLNQSMSKL